MVEKKKTIFANWISMGNVLTIISMAVGGLAVLARMSEVSARQDERLNATRERIEQVNQDQTQLRRDLHDELREIRTDVKELLQRNVRRKE